MTDKYLQHTNHKEFTKAEKLKIAHLNSAVEIVPYYLIDEVQVLSQNKNGGILFEIFLRRNWD